MIGGLISSASQTKGLPRLRAEKRFLLDTSSDPKKSHLYFLPLKAFQIKEKA